MKEDLCLPEGWDGTLWRFRYPGARVIRHHHDELEVNIVARGTARYLIGDQRFDLARNTQIWLFPAQDHLLIDQSSDYAMWIGVFKRLLLERVCVTPTTRPLLEILPAQPYITRLPSEQTSRLDALLGEVERTRADAACYNAGLAYALLLAWAAHQASQNTPLGRAVHPAVETAAYLLRDQREALTVAALARQVGLSASRLSRLFKEQTGVSLVTYRNRQYLDRFLALYSQSGGASMTQVMLEAGFGSYPQFYRVFKSSMDCGPAEYYRTLT